MASAYVHGQDIVTKLSPFTFYDVICSKLIIMSKYIFKSVRLINDNSSCETEICKFETELCNLQEKYMYSK